MTTPPIQDPGDRSESSDSDLDRGLDHAFANAGLNRPASSILRSLEDRAGSSLRVHLADHGPEPSPVKVTEQSKQLAPDSRYQVLGEIGRGGVGVVYQGRDVDLGRDVAMKVLRQEYAKHPEVLARFVEEAQVGGQLQHPGIVPVYELGLQGGEQPYFAMKLIKGETLAAQLARRANPTADRRRLLGVFEQICQTIAYAHARHVVHRDLKPTNVMIGSFGEVQVVDWGFAKVLQKGGVAEERAQPGAGESPERIETVRSKEGSGSQSMAGSLMGTPAYMPPEQALGDVDSLDTRSDVFGLGAILCELLTGQPPYIEAEGEVLVQAARAELEPAKQRLAGCGADPELVALCRDCLAPEQSDRPASAQVLADRVTGYLTSVEERARQAELQAARAQVRTRATLALAVAAVLLLVVGGGSYLWIEEQNAQQRQAAELRVATALQEANSRAADARARQGADLTAWATAVTAAEQAEQLARSDFVGNATRERVAIFLVEVRAAERAARDAEAASRRDQEMLRALADARISPFDEIGTEDVDPQEGLRIHRAYTAAFAAYRRQRPIQESTVEDCIAELRTSAIRAELAAGLDHWSLRRRHDGVIDDLTRRIESISDGIDGDDPWRAELRRTLRNEEAGVEALERLVADVDFATLPPTGLRLLAKGFYDRGATGRAAEILSTGIVSHPADFGLAFQLGALQEQREPSNWAGAAAQYRVAVALRPDLNNAWHRLGRVLQELRAFEESEQVFRLLIERDPMSGHWLRHFGETLRARGRFGEAEAVFRRARAITPEDPLTANLLGVALRDQDRNGEALQEFEAAIELGGDAPQDPSPFANLGNILADQGKMSRASELWSRALEMDPGFASALHNLAKVDLAAQRYGAALDKIDRAITSEPKLGALHVVRARALFHLDRKAEAEASARTGIALQGDRQGPDRRMASALDALGRAVATSGDLRGAREWFKAATDSDGSRGQAWVNLGMMELQLGLFVDAAASTARAETEFRRSVEEQGNRGFETWAARAAMFREMAEQGLAASERDQGILDGSSESFTPEDLAASAGRALLNDNNELAAEAYLELLSLDQTVFDAYPNRYSAVCAAGKLVAAGSEDSAVWRQRAYEWLSAELADEKEKIGSFFTRDAARGRLAHWEKDPDLAALRDSAAIDELPREEAMRWHELWYEARNASSD